MIKLLLAFFLLYVPVLYAKSSIASKIQKTQKELSNFDKKNSNLSTKVAKKAKEILRQKKKILKQQQKLKQLTADLKDKEIIYTKSKQNLTTLSHSQQELLQQQEELKQNLLFAIARNISLTLIVDEHHSEDVDSLITQEYIQFLVQDSKKTIKDLDLAYNSNSHKINSLKKETEDLLALINSIENKKADLIKTKKANEKALIKLKKDKNTYKKKLKKSINRQNAIQKTLTQLNILKQDSLKKERARQAKIKRERAHAKKVAAKTGKKQDLPAVKNFASPYTSIKTKSYKGRRTISPLTSYTITKKFGPYTDPIYKIKIFNESISMQPRNNSSKVRSVLNGKIILAKNTPLLDNIVIIEHTNGIHTIYAHLDKIAPTIKNGKRVKKGAVIGRVENELMFEVTQKSYHINPSQLIFKSK